MANLYNLLDPNAYYPKPYGQGYSPSTSPFALSDYGQPGPSTFTQKPTNLKNTLINAAVQTLLPQIMPKGIDTSFSGVGLGNINLGNYGAGPAVSNPLDQMNSLAYQQRAYNAMTPMYQDMRSMNRQQNINDFNTMQSAQAPWLQWAANQAPAQQSRIFGASKGNYYDRMGMAAMANAAAAAAQPQRAFGRQGIPGTNFGL